MSHNESPAGYNRGENLKWLDTSTNIDPYISMNDRHEDTKTDLEKAIGSLAFTYNDDADHWECPTTKLLIFGG